MNFTLHQSMHEANVLRCPNNLIKLMQCLNSSLVGPDLMRDNEEIERSQKLSSPV